MFYVYSNGKEFIKTTPKLRLKVVKDIAKCSYWTNIKAAKSWEQYVKRKHPEFVLTPAILTIKK